MWRSRASALVAGATLVGALFVAAALAPAHADPRPTTGGYHLQAPVLKAGNGHFKPVGTRVDGFAATYLARVKKDSATVSLLWIDTSLTRAIFSPGYEDPGGPNSGGGLASKYWPAVVANFNGAFKMSHTRGGYYYRGTTIAPLVNGRASAVTYVDGTIAIGKWGRDVRMSGSVEAVRQNIDLIVDRSTSQVTNPNDALVWGPTTDKGPRESRSAVGQRADGSIVYAMGANLRATDLASALVDAGVVRAMVLDMNQYWPAGFYFSHKRSGKPVCAKVDSSIADGCERLLTHYKKDSFQFIAANR